MRKTKIEMRVVFTIGHSTRTWKEFLEILRAHGIKRVIDVRSIPRSRHNPQFNQEILRTKLRVARIGYVHLPKLGGRRRTRRDSPNMGWRNVSFRGYADYMQTSDFDAGLQRLIKLAGQKRSAVMCAEAVPWRCHRSLIGDALTVRGIRVEDILSKTRSQLHSVTSFARVRGNRITYPIGRESRLVSLKDLRPMAKTFKVGDHVEWNSEAGRVRGVIFKKVVSDVDFKGYIHHASKEEPQFFIKSDKTDHIAIHKGRALKLIPARAKKQARKIVRKPEPKLG